MVVVGDGDALRIRRDGDDFEGFAGRNVQHGDRSGHNIRGVAAAAVVGEREHVALRRAGGDGADDLEGFGIDEGDRVVQARW